MVELEGLAAHWKGHGKNLEWFSRRLKSAGCKSVSFYVYWRNYLDYYPSPNPTPTKSVRSLSTLPAEGDIRRKWKQSCFKLRHSNITTLALRHNRKPSWSCLSYALCSYFHLYYNTLCITWLLDCYEITSTPPPSIEYCPIAFFMIFFSSIDAHINTIILMQWFKPRKK